jgi:hypothetical protein
MATWNLPLYSFKFVATALLLLLLAEVMPTTVSAGCYKSGQWGKLPVMDAALDNFLDRYDDGIILEPGWQLFVSSPVSPGGNGRCYVWEITYKNKGSGSVQYNPDFVKNAAGKVRDDCKGDNDDSQGGDWVYSDQHYISVDANAVAGSVGKEC